jgi:hypothetical protein
VTTVEDVLIELPSLPQPDIDIAQDDDGYSAEVSVERSLSLDEVNAFSEACRRLAPAIAVDGEHELRGLVSVDDETLWVYVHEVGPGPYGAQRELAAHALLERLWRSVHEAAAAL